jgi:hypothetical protein
MTFIVHGRAFNTTALNPPNLNGFGAAANTLTEVEEKLDRKISAAADSPTRARSRLRFHYAQDPHQVSNCATTDTPSH